MEYSSQLEVLPRGDPAFSPSMEFSSPKAATESSCDDEDLSEIWFLIGDSWFDTELGMVVIGTSWFDTELGMVVKGTSWDLTKNSPTPDVEGAHSEKTSEKQCITKINKNSSNNWNSRIKLQTIFMEATKGKLPYQLNYTENQVRKSCKKSVWKVYQ